MPSFGQGPSGFRFGRNSLAILLPPGGQGLDRRTKTVRFQLAKLCRHHVGHAESLTGTGESDPTPTAGRLVVAARVFAQRVARNSMIAPRSSALLKRWVMRVPGTIAPGLVRNASSVSGLQVIPEFRRDGE